MRVLVCGGRNYSDECRIFKELDSLHFKRKIQLIIHGGASGADWLARKWAGEKGVDHSEFKANWSKHGRAAGPIRNKQMIDEGKPDLVVAFPGGCGTANMIKLARDAGIEVIEISDPGEEIQNVG